MVAKKKDEWLKIVADFNKSGLSRKEFASKHNLQYKSLCNWIRSSGQSALPQLVPVKIVKPVRKKSFVLTDRYIGLDDEVLGASVGSVSIRFFPTVDPNYIGLLLSNLAGQI